jgi:hypothetical protein
MSGSPEPAWNRIEAGLRLPFARGGGFFIEVRLVVEGVEGRDSGFGVSKILSLSKGGVRGAGCGVRDSGCGMRDAGCGMRGAGCGVRGAGCGVG